MAGDGGERSISSVGRADHRCGVTTSYLPTLFAVQLLTVFAGLGLVFGLARGLVRKDNIYFNPWDHLFKGERVSRRSAVDVEEAVPLPAPSLPPPSLLFRLLVFRFPPPRPFAPLCPRWRPPFFPTHLIGSLSLSTFSFTAGSAPGSGEAHSHSVAGVEGTGAPCGDAGEGGGPLPLLRLGIPP